MTTFKLSSTKVWLAGFLTLVPLILGVLLLIDQVERPLRPSSFPLQYVFEPLPLTLILAAASAYALWMAWRVRGTRIDEKGVRQPGLRGTNEVKWTDARRIDVIQGTVLRLRGSEGSVLIPLHLYDNPVQLHAFVHDMLQRHGRLNSPA